MKAILGRLSDLGVKELFKLLTSAGAAGELEVESAGVRTRLRVRQGHVRGEPSPALVNALATRSGTFCFTAGPVAEDGEWFGLEEFLARIDAKAADGSAALPAAAAGDGAGGTDGDLLAELRHSLAEVPLPGVGPRILVVTADPRPYRVLEPDWRQRGWDVAVHHEVAWAEGYNPSAVVVHLPSSATLSGQGDAWLQVLGEAATQEPPAPVVWVGGLADPWLRHQAIVGGAEFLLPAPAGEVGETARWFRDELTAVLERLLARRESGVQREAAAFRDFFLALHADAAPAEGRASLLRFAANFFAAGLLLAVHDGGFDSLGGFGLPGATPGRLPRGSEALERVVIDHRPLRSDDIAPVEAGSLRTALGLASGEVEVFPLLRGGDCIAVLVGHSRLPDVPDTTSLASLLARSGSII